MTTFPWTEARRRARAGRRVRHVGWNDRWLRSGRVLFYVTAPDGSWAQRVVQAEDFGRAEFFGEWTEEAPADVDVCRRPPRRNPTLVPPSLSLDASVMGEVVLAAVLGASEPAGAYWLEFFVAGAAVGVRPAPVPGRYAVSTTADPAWMTGDALDVRVVARSTPPLPAWTGEARATVGTWTGGAFGTWELFEPELTAGGAFGTWELFEPELTAGGAFGTWELFEPELTAGGAFGDWELFSSEP